MLKTNHPIGKSVYLSAPTIQNLDEFLSRASQSQPLHAPWIIPPSNQQQFEAYLNKINLGSNEGFFIKQHETNHLVGVININEIVRGCFQSGYLGFYIFQGFENQGLMTEGLKLALAHAFNRLKLHRLEANIQPKNLKSIALRAC